MSLRDDKRTILTKISGYASFNEVENTDVNNDSLSTVNNKKDPIEFLIAVLGSLVGTEAIKIIVGNIIGGFIDESEDFIKEVIKQQFIIAESNNELPSDFKNVGYNIPIRDIDSDGKFKVSKDSTVGNVLYSYEGTKPVFDNDVYRAMLNHGNDVESGNLILNYNKDNQFLNVKPKHDSQTIYTFFNDTVDNYQIFNKNEIVSKAIDKIFGTISKETNKTENQIRSELILDKKLENFTNGNESFELNNSELKEIDDDVFNLKNGEFLSSIGCGMLIKTINVEDIDDLLQDIKDVSDPKTISDTLDNLINESETNVPNNINEKNINTVKDNFFKRLINYIKLNLVKAITTSPTIKLLFALKNGFTNVVSDIRDTENFIKSNINLIRCIIKALINRLVKFIYDLVIKYLIKLVKPVIRKILVERINSYVGIIKSLIKK